MMNDKTIDEMIKDFENDTMETKLDPDCDYTPVFWNGMLVGIQQDLIDGKIDPLDRDAWKP